MEHESEILDLILSSAGKAAPYITEKLRSIEDGSMSEGIHALVEFAAKSGIELGEKSGLKKGVILGICGAFAVAGSVQIALGFYQNRMKRICNLQEVEQKIKASDEEPVPYVTEAPSYEDVKELKDDEEGEI